MHARRLPSAGHAAHLARQVRPDEIGRAAHAQARQIVARAAHMQRGAAGLQVERGDPAVGA